MHLHSFLEVKQNKKEFGRSFTEHDKEVDINWL